MNVRLLFTLLLSIVVTACAPLTAPETATPTETPAAPETLQPTDTTTPTETPLPSATPNPIATIVALQSPIVHSTFNSPNGQWRVDLLRYECIKLSPDSTDEMTLEQLRLVHLADGTEKVLASQSLYCVGLGAFGFGGHAWSPNSRYFYFTDARESMPDGGAMCYWYRSLLRVEAESGAIESLLPGVLSPDNTLIAMADRDELVLWDLDDGEIARVPVPTEGMKACTSGDYAAWEITWDSPDRVRLQDESGAEWTLDVATRELTKVE